LDTPSYDAVSGNIGTKDYNSCGLKCLTVMSRFVAATVTQKQRSSWFLTFHVNKTELSIIHRPSSVKNRLWTLRAQTLGITSTTVLFEQDWKIASFHVMEKVRVQKPQLFSDVSGEKKRSFHPNSQCR
jgi:hypothetical protein